MIALKNLDNQVLLSVHCHNDLGMAKANTLAAIKNRADKVECTINGIGERARNASLEEVVMAIRTRSEIYQAYKNVNTKEIMNTSRMVSGLMGLDDMELVLTARSGRHAVKTAFEQLGMNHVTNSEFEGIFKGFLQLADAKKEVYNHNLYVIIESYYKKHNRNNQEANHYSNNFYELIDLQVISNTKFPSASVELKKADQVIKGSAVGSGPIDAIYSAIMNECELDIKLIQYDIRSVSRGKEAIGKVKIQIEYKGETYIAKASDTDILKASADAYINAINNIVIDHSLPVKSTLCFTESSC